MCWESEAVVDALWSLGSAWEAFGSLCVSILCEPLACGPEERGLCWQVTMKLTFLQSSLRMALSITAGFVLPKPGSLASLETVTSLYPLINVLLL